MVAALLLLLFAFPLQAQVNIETYRGEQGVGGDLRFSLRADLGNVDVVKSDWAGHLTIRTATGVFLGICKGGVGLLGGKRFANSGVLHLRWTLTADSRYQPEVFGQGDYAKPRRLDTRMLAGAGLRFNAYQQEHRSFSLGAALMWERERLTLLPGDPHPASTQLVRWSSYANFSYRGNVDFATTVYAQPAFSEWGNLRVLGTVELSTLLIGPLRQTTSIDFRIDTQSPRGVEERDLKFGTSFGLKF